MRRNLRVKIIIVSEIQRAVISGKRAWFSLPDNAFQLRQVFGKAAFFLVKFEKIAHHLRSGFDGQFRRFLPIRPPELIDVNDDDQHQAEGGDD